MNIISEEQHQNVDISEERRQIKDLPEQGSDVEGACTSLKYAALSDKGLQVSRVDPNQQFNHSDIELPASFHWNIRRIILGYSVPIDNVISINTPIAIISWYKNQIPIQDDDFNRTLFLYHICSQENPGCDLLKWSIDNVTWDWDRLCGATERFGYNLKCPEHVKLLISMKKAAYARYEIDIDIPTSYSRKESFIYNCSWMGSCDNNRVMFLDAYNKLKCDIDLVKELITEFKITDHEMACFARYVIYSGDLEFAKYLDANYKFGREIFWQDVDYVQIFEGSKPGMQSWLIKKFGGIG